MPVIGIIIPLILIFSEIRKMNAIVIRINKSGLQISRKSFMNWDDINDEKIISRSFTLKESRHNSKCEVNYLSLYYKNERIEFKTDELAISECELDHYLKIYRERFNDNKNFI